MDIQIVLEKHIFLLDLIATREIWAFVVFFLLPFQDFLCCGNEYLMHSYLLAKNSRIEETSEYRKNVKVCCIQKRNFILFHPKKLILRVLKIFNDYLFYTFHHKILIHITFCLLWNWFRFKNYVNCPIGPIVQFI